MPQVHIWLLQIVVLTYQLLGRVREWHMGCCLGQPCSMSACTAPHCRPRRQSHQRDTVDDKSPFDRPAVFSRLAEDQRVGVHRCEPGRLFDGRGMRRPRRRNRGIELRMRLHGTGDDIHALEITYLYQQIDQYLERWLLMKAGRPDASSKKAPFAAP